jgi:glutamate synthase (NADPH/NADH) small chain
MQTLTEEKPDNVIASELLSSFSKNHDCPFGEGLQETLKLVKSGKLDHASKILSQNPFPILSLKLCNWDQYFPPRSNLPQKLESLLEKLPSEKITKSKKRSKSIGIIGSGICGLTAAKRLALLGYTPTVYEALPQPGGFLRYVVPEFVLPKEMLNNEIEKLEELGVEFVTNKVIGKAMALSDLESQHNALFLASGASSPKMIHLEGQHLNNVYYANEYLLRINLMQAHQYPKFQTPLHSASNTMVVGGGSVALYCARIAKRLGNEVTVSYRRSANEMTSFPHEIQAALDEGIKFLEMTMPSRILGEEFVEEIEILQMMLEAEDERGRRNPISIEDSAFAMPVDQVILAVGETQNPLLLRDSQLRTGFGNKIIVNEQMQTNKESIFAGGDVVKQSINTQDAISAGSTAALNIDKFLQNSK